MKGATQVRQGVRCDEQECPCEENDCRNNSDLPRAILSTVYSGRVDVLIEGKRLRVDVSPGTSQAVLPGCAVHVEVGSLAGW